MTETEFEKLVLSKVRTGPFQPMVLHDCDNDALEVLISDESYKAENAGDGLVVYCGRESGSITGVRIRNITRFIKDINIDTPDLPDVSIRRGPVASWVESKFIKLRDEWKAQRRHQSSTSKIVMLPAYQKIIGMGPDVVPLLLRELEGGPDVWFWALMAITEADPVPEGARGDGQAMARAWLDWAKDQGYSW